MIEALGFSQTPFDPRKPGRLCRGRERWIEPWELSDDDIPEVYRLVVSGAKFTDESAADAQRGLTWSGLEVVEVVAGLFPRRQLLAFMEDGHPADIPRDAEGIEMYEGYRAGGIEEPLVRWHIRLKGITQLRELVGDEPIEERLRGLALIDADADDEAVMESLFGFVGFSTRDSPPARYQPAALPDVLKVVKAVVVFHRDKNGPALGVYGREPVDKPREKLQKVCDKHGTLLVPFAIPPMLARWDRALSELRAEWMATREDEFPVPPPPPDVPTWADRRRRRRNRSGRRNKSEARKPKQQAKAAEE